MNIAKISKSLLLSLLSLIIIGFMQCNTQSPLEEHKWTNLYGNFRYQILKLKGNVKSVEMLDHNLQDSLKALDLYEFNKYKALTKHVFKGNNTNGEELIQYNEKDTIVQHEEYKNGLLSKLETTIEEVDEQQNIVQKRTYNKDNKLVISRNYTYDENNNLKTSKTIYWENGEFTEIQYSYNDKQIMTEMISHEYDKDSNQTKKIHLKYNDLGQQILEEFYFAEDLHCRDIYTYNDKNALIEHTTFQPDVPSKTKRSIRYNDEGIKLDSSELMYWNRNSAIALTTLYEEEIHQFDKAENIIKKVFKEEGEVIRIISLKYTTRNILKEEIITYPQKKDYIKVIYDKFGNPKLKLFFDDKGKLTNKEAHQIKYDRYGNMTEIIFTEDDEVLRIQQRKYEYY